MADDPVLFDELPCTDGKRIGIATLNAEKSLNSLTLPMIDRLRPRLAEWERDDGVACVVMRAAGGKAFCAGGDIVELYKSMTSGDGYAAEFFEREYRLDYQIHTYSKPVVNWGHGVIMGGGFGVCAGASHRVVTEKTRMAMPEVTIGLFPDVGGTWFLNRAPGRTGLFMALTGVSINAADAIFCDFADRFIEQRFRDEVIDALAAVEWAGDSRHRFGQVSHVLHEFEQRSADAYPQSQFRTHFDRIGQLTDADDIEQVVAQLQSCDNRDEWLAKAAAKVDAGCPTTIRLIDEQFRRGRYLSLAEVFRLELTMSLNCVRLGNFAEGVRALLIDKDRSPRFVPPTLAEVSDEWVEKHFEPPWGDAPHPLADL